MSEMGTNGSGAAFMEQASQRLDQLRSDFEDADRRARAFVQEYPLSCLAGAVVLGYILARLGSRI
jgi:hypothetical protein